MSSKYDDYSDEEIVQNQTPEVPLAPNAKGKSSTTECATKISSCGITSKSTGDCCSIKECTTGDSSTCATQECKTDASTTQKCGTQDCGTSNCEPKDCTTQKCGTSRELPTGVSCNDYNCCPGTSAWSGVSCNPPPSVSSSIDELMNIFGKSFTTPSVASSSSLSEMLKLVSQCLMTTSSTKSSTILSECDQIWSGLDDISDGNLRAICFLHNLNRFHQSVKTQFCHGDIKIERTFDRLQREIIKTMEQLRH